MPSSRGTLTCKGDDQQASQAGIPHSRRRTPVTASTNELFPAKNQSFSDRKSLQTPPHLPDCAPITANRGISRVPSLALTTAVQQPVNTQRRDTDVPEGPKIAGSLEQLTAPARILTVGEGLIAATSGCIRGAAGIRGVIWGRGKRRRGGCRGATGVARIRALAPLLAR